jgi:hypothetical protein
LVGLGESWNVEIHPGNPEGFNFVVVVLSDLASDFRSVNAEEVLDLGDATRGEESRSPGTTSESEAAEEGFFFILAATEFAVESVTFIELGAADVGSEEFEAFGGAVGFARESLEVAEVGVGVADVGVRKDSALFGVDR